MSFGRCTVASDIKEGSVVQEVITKCVVLMGVGVFDGYGKVDRVHLSRKCEDGDPSGMAGATYGAAGGASGRRYKAAEQENVGKGVSEVVKWDACAESEPESVVEVLGLGAADIVHILGGLAEKDGGRWASPWCMGGERIVSGSWHWQAGKGEGEGGAAAGGVAGR